jgi:hypothetical protein
MLYLIGAVLLAVWVLGLAFKVTTALIHVALVAALVVFAFSLLGGRRGRGTAVP